VEESYVAEDTEYGVEEAAEWGSDFVWPLDVANRDSERLLRCGNDIVAMTEQLHTEMKDMRLSGKRVDALVQPDNPDYQRLLKLCEGMDVILAKGFKPNGKPAPLRSLYKRTSKAVNKMVLDLWKNDLAFIIPTEIAVNIPGIHFTPAHWAKKRGKKSGRHIFDSSDTSAGSAINSDEAREALKRIYGDIVHPTIDQIVQMILDFETKMKSELKDEYNSDEIYLWKADLAKAFTLLNFKASNVPLLACPLTDGLTLIYHTGLFGWTGTPYAFQVVTRVIKSCIKAAAMKGDMDMYVDDLFGVVYGLLGLFHDRNISESICRGLLGPAAMADKNDDGRILEVIGWTINMNTRLVTLSRKNYMKMVYRFFSINPEQPVQLREIEKLAALSSRYTKVLRHMRPFTTLLFGELQGMHNRSVFKQVRDTTRIAVYLWRAVLCVLNFSELSFARTLESFNSNTQSPTYMIEYDASLEGIGIILTDISGPRHKLIGVSSCMFNFDLKHMAKYQNTAEFIAVLVGVMSLVRLGAHNCGIHLVGDNMSSLKWSSTEHFKGVLSLRASVMYILTGVQFGIEIITTEHIPGDRNIQCDALSRGSSPQELGYTVEQILIVDDFVNRLFELCDPTKPFESIEDMFNLWISTSDLLSHITKNK
jgi:hypothetical protein